MKNHHTEEGANDVVDKPTAGDGCGGGRSLLHDVKLSLHDECSELTQLTIYSLLRRVKPSYRRQIKCYNRQAHL